MKPHCVLVLRGGWSIAYSGAIRRQPNSTCCDRSLIGLDPVEGDVLMGFHNERPRVWRVYTRKNSMGNVWVVSWQIVVDSPKKKACEGDEKVRIEFVKPDMVRQWVSLSVRSIALGCIFADCSSISSPINNGNSSIDIALFCNRYLLSIMLQQLHWNFCKCLHFLDLLVTSP